jgi:subtilisin family serine protease
MCMPAGIFRAATAALAIALIGAPAAAASRGPAMSAADVRAMQAQGVREVIVERKAGVTPAEQSVLRAQAGVSYVGPGPLLNTEIDRAPAGGLASAVAALNQDSQVQFAEPNGEVTAAATPNDTYFSQQWAQLNSGQSVEGTSGTAGDDIGATFAWPHSIGSGVTVAVVDTGVDSTAPDLQGRITAGQSFLNGVQGTNTQDQNGHGTHVSGIIAAVQNNGVGVSGVAPGASVEPLRVLDSTGHGTFDDVAGAFAYAGQNGIKIVNASLGGDSTSQTLETAIEDYPNTLYVVAAGNDGADNDDPSSPFYPCDLPEANVICVGATDQSDQLAWFTDYGAGSVDLFAPGVNILSTWMGGGYAYADGTSMATPMVSGTLALMLAHQPSLTAAQLKADLLASVDPAPQLTGSSVTGGELDAAAAVALAGGDTPYGPPANRGLPTVAGIDAVGRTLTAGPGSWSRSPAGYTYQWQRCLLGVCLPVLGATSQNYTVAPGDYGASFDVVVTASNAVGSVQATSPIAPPAGSATPPTSGAPRPAPPPSGIPAGTPAGTPVAHVPVQGVRLWLSHVAVRGGRGRQALVFTLSANARVQITVRAASRVSSAAADVLRLAVSGRRGANHYALSSLPGGRRLRVGRYALTVRAGNRSVTVSLNVA